MFVPVKRSRQVWRQTGFYCSCRVLFTKFAGMLIMARQTRLKGMAESLLQTPGERALHVLAASRQSRLDTDRQAHIAGLSVRGLAMSGGGTCRRSLRRRRTR